MKKYILRKIELKQDCSQLFELIINQYRNSVPFTHQHRFIDVDEYQHWLAERLGGYFHDFYVVEERNDMNIVKLQGFFFSYDYRIYDSHCHIYGYMRYGIDSIILGQFVEILFKEYPLNKVFLETTENDDKLLNAAYDLGFIQEAMLIENFFINGQYHNLIILSLYPKGRRRLL